MIHGPSVPAVLVEYGYLSNPSEAALFATDKYIRTGAAATADAIEAYLQTNRPGTGFVQQPRVFDPVSPPGRCDETTLEWALTKRCEPGVKRRWRNRPNSASISRADGSSSLKAD